MDLREVLIRALRGPFSPREELWLFPADAESGDGRPTKLSAPTHPPGWETWPDELKEQYLQLIRDRETAVGLITLKNRLVLKCDQLERELSKSTDLAECKGLQEELDALVEPRRRMELAVSELKEVVKSRDSAWRIAHQGYQTFKVTDFATLTPEQKAQIDQLLNELKAKLIPSQENDSG